MRLDKYLSDRNLGTRRELREAVRAGRVLVDGEIAGDPGVQLRGGEIVQFDGKTLDGARYVYYMLNKPAGVISAVKDPRHRTVLDLMGESARRDLFPVGRLDIDTTGLLFLTNDGAFDHRLMSPKKHVPKTYEARVSGIVSPELKASFAEGVDLSDFRTQPAELVLPGDESGEEGTTRVLLTIREGKYHQVKRMFAAFGHEVLSLSRVAVGPVKLDPALPEGAFRPLTEEELAALT